MASDTWRGKKTELDGVKKAAQNVDDPRQLAEYVYDRSSAYIGPGHESMVVSLTKQALVSWATRRARGDGEVGDRE